jgi:hypothetical protein
MLPAAALVPRASAEVERGAGTLVGEIPNQRPLRDDLRLPEPHLGLHEAVRPSRLRMLAATRSGARPGDQPMWSAALARLTADSTVSSGG